LDTTVAVVSRIHRGLTPFNGGKDHLSHRLVRIGLTPQQAAIILWGSSAASSLVAYLIYKYTEQFGTELVFSTSVAWVVAAIFFLRVSSEDIEVHVQATNNPGQ
jgi:UDP-GlcNAc:undecaprenyl-phosphate GlcNAc-1-phosphate transferase